MSKRAWAKMVQQYKANYGEHDVREPEPKPRKQRDNFAVLLPNQITPRVLKVVFESLIRNVPLEKYDDDCELILTDKVIKIKFTDRSGNHE